MLLEIAILLLLALIVLLQILQWRKGSGAAAPDPQEIAAQASQTRQELHGMFGQLQQNTLQQFNTLGQSQGAQLHRFAEQLQQLAAQLQQQSQAAATRQEQQAREARNELGASLLQMARAQQQQLQAWLQQIGENNQQRLLEVRGTLNEKLAEMQQENAQRLEEMRKTVDEKLHATLEQRLGESFRIVSERLEKVHQGLGEMQQLASGVGDLKRVLVNVKTRGVWGEVQLAMLLEQILTPEQYATNVETVPGSNARVEFALRLPSQEGQAVWLPIDAKFPKEAYERMQLAAERADLEAHAQAGRELEKQLRLEAKTIAEKYLAAPWTTDFAILFLPTEGLYAEAMQRPGLADELQRNARVMVAGPSTLAALLNSLQIGFRSIALEKRSHEVWQVLGAVKTEFGKFGDALAKTRESLERAARQIESAETRSRQMQRKLKGVEALPGEQAQDVLRLDGEEN
ncbi:DNA recombination protein RmuC [Massilia sp. W12]|uniref:DNA recombination protein RmuC n=1 Tax=Massilia sp. W12 TaxID=3126507 RepID=UPI0030D064DC